jgi:hypothetical protein
MWHIKKLKGYNKRKTDQFCKVIAVHTSLHGSETCAQNHKRLWYNNCLRIFF